MSLVQEKGTSVIVQTCEALKPPKFCLPKKSTAVMWGLQTTKQLPHLPWTGTPEFQLANKSLTIDSQLCLAVCKVDASVERLRY